MSAIDERGFIPIDEVQNIFITELAKITQDLHVNGVPMDEKIIYEYIDTIRLRLMQKAKYNIDTYLKQHPSVRAEIRAEKENLEQTSGRKSYKERIKDSREKAIKYSESL